MKIATRILLVAATFGSSLAMAQTGGIGSVTVSPNPVQAGKEVSITIAAEGEAPGFCGLVVHFDDGGESRQIKINGRDAKFPVTLAKTYAKPGTYSIKAEGRKITTHFPCTGVATAQLVVEAPPRAAAPSCPEGWKMAGKPGKAGDFRCNGSKQAVMPREPLSCAAGLEPYANEKARQVGCRKPAKKN